MNSDISGLFNYTSTRRGAGNKSDVLPDPFMMYSTTQMPRNMTQVLRLCEHVWLTSGQYKMAMQRIGRYFLTRIVFDNVSDKEKKKYEEFFKDVLHIMTLLAEIADDFLCYGNSFTSLYLPFNRILICDKCHFTQNIDKIPDSKLTLDVKKMKFMAFCPRCKKTLPQTHKDLRSQDEERMHVIRWNPHEFQLLHNFMSGESSYLWDITSDIKSHVKSGKAFWLRRLPWEVMQAVSKNSLFRFKDDVVYHVKEPCISGVVNRGWGIPRMLAAYKDIYYIQVLKRFNEALAMDYIVPFRIITPAKATSADPLMQQDLGVWKNKIQDMISEHRRDPAGYNTLPFPVQYQVLGGEGQSLSPWQLLKQGTGDMLDSLGVPIELFQGSMQLKSAPTALRLFEATWPHMVAALDGWLQWLMSKLATTFGWEEATAHLQRVTYADDMERRQMIWQMGQTGDISKQTAYRSLDIDADEEQRRTLEETRSQQDAQREFEEVEFKRQEMEETMAQHTAPPQQVMPGMMPGAPMPGVPMGMAPPEEAMMAGAGAPAGPAPGAAVPQPLGGMPGMEMAGLPQAGAVTPQELLVQAEQLAQQLYAMDASTRKSQLIQLKQTNPILHAQVKQLLENYDQQAGQQGVMAGRQQAMQGMM